MSTIKLHIYDDLKIIVGILTQAGYTVHTKKVMMECPSEHRIDYFEVSYEEGIE